MAKKLEKAIRLAVKLHEGQYRDGPDALPYITHAFDVMTNLRTVGGVIDEDMLAAAILHDAIEETEATESTIVKAVGSVVAALVVELTRKEPSPKQFKSLGSNELYNLRSQMLLEGIEKMSIKAKIIKLADRLANVKDSIRTRSGEKHERYLIQTDRILELIPRSLNEALWDAVWEARNSDAKS